MSEDLEIITDPISPQEAIRLARERLTQGDLDGADQSLRTARDRNPADPNLLSLSSDIAARRGDHAAAIEWIQQAIDAKPDDLHTRNRLATLHMDRHDLPAAEAALTQAL
jgi:predicted Zn-dependent protease